MASLGDIPPEIVEQIIIHADPLDLPALAQTASIYYTITNPPNYQRLWQTLFLAQPLDDPRTCCDQYGRPTFPSSFDWREELRKILRAKKAVLRMSCKAEGRCEVLTTLLHLITNIPPRPSPAHPASLNLAWVASLLQNSTYLDTSFTASPEEDQLRSRIHAHFGLTTSDLVGTNLTKSRGYAYDMRNYCVDTNYGPFMAYVSGDDEDDWQAGRLVNWTHVQAIHHVISMHVVKDSLEGFKRRQEKGKWRNDEDEFKDFIFIQYPLSLPYCQSVIPEGFDLDVELDWAGVEGLWECNFCYFDHRELMLYNKFGVGALAWAPLDTSFFDKVYFREILRTLTFDIHITGIEINPLHPTRPNLHFAGDDPVNQPVAGWVAYTPENCLRWYFEYGSNGRMMWSCSGVQVGSVRSPFGVLGGWSAVNHDQLSPIGPFWLHKINDPVRAQLHGDNADDGIRSDD